MDSLGDDLTVLAGTVGLFFFKLEFLKEQWIFFVILLVLFIIQVLTAFYKFGKTTSFHTYFAKLAAILQGCFLILVFFTPEPWLPLFYAAIGITMIELIEEIILVFVVPKWETDIKGLYWVLKKKGKK